MDIIDSCKAILKDKLQGSSSQGDDGNSDVATQTLVQSDTHYETQCDSQSFFEGYFSETDKNLNKILNQQSNLKRVIDQDNSIQLTKSMIIRLGLEIESLRKACTKENEEALNKRQELAEAQAKELERFQMCQIRSIAEDYTRHQDILGQRKKEIQSLHKEIEKQQKEREAYLADIEKKLERQIQDRHNARGGSLPFQSVDRVEAIGPDDNQNNTNRIDLTSVDEYAPYGVAPHSRLPTNSHSTSTRGRGRGRGRRKRGGS